MHEFWIPLDIIAERFWPKVDKSGGPDACWPWTAGCHKDGYGLLRVGKGVLSKGGKQILAHRVSVALDGRSPGENCTCHTCDNPPCVNPKHLVVASVAWNQADKMRKGRIFHKLTDRQIREIYDLCNPYTYAIYTRVAERFGVSIALVSLIARRKHRVLASQGKVTSIGAVPLIGVSKGRDF